MKVCTKCNIDYDGNKKFCKNCGSSLAAKHNLDPRKQAKVSVFEEKLKAEPLNMTILRDYLEFLHNESLFDNIVSVALRILAIDENNLETKKVLLSAYNSLGSNQDAIKIGEEIFSEQSDDPAFLEHLGHAYHKTGLTEKALSAYDDILKKQPDNYNVLHKKGLALLENKEMKEAAKVFDTLQEKGVKDATTMVYSGIHKAINEAYPEAIKALEDLMAAQAFSHGSIERNRASLYLAGCFAFSRQPIKVVARWFNEIDIQVLKDHHQELDEYWYATISLHMLIDELENFTPSREYADLEEFKEMAEVYIYDPEFYYTNHTRHFRAEMWALIGAKMQELGYLKESIRAFEKAVEHNPDETQYTENANNAKQALEELKRRREKRSIIVWSVFIAIIVIIIVYLEFFN